MHTVDVDDPFFAVDLGDFALPTLELAPYDQYLVIFAYRERADLSDRSRK